MRISTSALYLTGLMFVLVSAGEAFAAPPKKPKLGQYTRLWTNSPFTIKPEVKKAGKESPLERDWMLGSIRRSGAGYSVTLINKKDRKDRVRFLPGVAANGFELLEVKQNAKDTKSSQVKIRKGTQEAWITYDAELVKVRTSSKAKTTSKTSSRTGAARPPIPGQTRSSGGSRVRSVPRSGR